MAVDLLEGPGQTGVTNFLHTSAGTSNTYCPVLTVLCHYARVGGPCNVLLRLDPVDVGVLLQLSQEVRAPSCLFRN